MILVSAFYAISWLPTYVYLLLVKLNPHHQVIEVVLFSYHHAHDDITDF